MEFLSLDATCQQEMVFHICRSLFFLHSDEDCQWTAFQASNIPQRYISEDSVSIEKDSCVFRVIATIQHF